MRNRIRCCKVVTAPELQCCYNIDTVLTLKLLCTSVVTLLQHRIQFRRTSIKKHVEPIINKECWCGICNIIRVLQIETSRKMKWQPHCSRMKIYWIDIILEPHLHSTGDLWNNRVHSYQHRDAHCLWVSSAFYLWAMKGKNSLFLLA
jgi:hypothetical protein